MALFPLSKLGVAPLDVKLGFALALIGLLSFAALHLLPSLRPHRRAGNSAPTWLLVARWSAALLTMVGIAYARPWALDGSHPLVWVRHSAVFILFAIILSAFGRKTSSGQVLIVTAGGLLAIHLICAARLIFLHDGLMDSASVLSDSRPPVLALAAVPFTALVFAALGFVTILRNPSSATACSTCVFLFAMVICSESLMLAGSIQNAIDHRGSYAHEIETESNYCADFAVEASHKQASETGNSSCPSVAARNFAIGRAAVAGNGGAVDTGKHSPLDVCFGR